MSKRKTPILRFKGFNNAWEQRKLGDIVTPIKTYSLTRAFETLKNTNFKYIHYGDIHTGKAKIIQNPSTLPSIKKNDNYITLKPNDIIIADASEDYKGIADAAILKDCGNYKIVAGLHTIAIRPNSCNVSSFIYILLGRDDFKHWGYKVGTGLKVFGITLKNFLKYKTFYPSLNEQKAISNLLNLVDNLLDLQKRKYKELKLLKKALLQNMFANKSLYPKLRFKGFTDKWKQEKLNSIASLLNGRAYKRNELLNSGKYPVLRVGNFYTNDKWYFSNLELKTNKYAIKGDLLYTWSATFGPHIWTGKKVIYHYHIWKIILKNNVDKFFVYEFLKEDRDQLLRNTNGSTMIHITKSNMENKYISLPNKKGQKKIGNFFKKFDNLIIAQNKKYNELKFIKKFLLQNMFI